MKYLILLLCITYVVHAYEAYEYDNTNYVNYCSLKTNYRRDPWKTEDWYIFDCNGLSETSVVYETCCAGRNLEEGLYTNPESSSKYACGGDDEDMCKKSTKFCEWNGTTCLTNPCGNAKKSDEFEIHEACENAKFNGKQCKWVSHEKYSYCSSASSLTVGLSSLLVLYSTLF